MDVENYYTQQTEDRDVWDCLLSQQMPSWHLTHLHSRPCMLCVSAIIQSKSFCYADTLGSTKLSTLLSWWRGEYLEEKGRFASWSSSPVSTRRFWRTAGLPLLKGYCGCVHTCQCQQRREEAWTIGRNTSPNDLLQVTGGDWKVDSKLIQGRGWKSVRI